MNKNRLNRNLPYDVGRIGVGLSTLPKTYSRNIKKRPYDLNLVKLGKLYNHMY